MGLFGALNCRHPNLSAPQLACRRQRPRAVPDLATPKGRLCLLGRLDLIHIIKLRRVTFLKRILCVSSDNCIVRDLRQLFISSPERQLVQNDAGISFNDSISFIKSKITASFHSKFLTA